VTSNFDNSAYEEYSESIPVNIFVNRSLSILESIVIYLKSEYGFSFNEIATRLGKNYRTIWTVYKRALKKLEHE
jgi:DNA-binding NarL/FixJ family response regulator